MHDRNDRTGLRVAGNVNDAPEESRDRRRSDDGAAARRHRPRRGRLETPHACGRPLIEGRCRARQSRREHPPAPPAPKRRWTRRAGSRGSRRAQPPVSRPRAPPQGPPFTSFTRPEGPHITDRSGHAVRASGHNVPRLLLSFSDRRASRDRFGDISMPRRLGLRPGDARDSNRPARSPARSLRASGRPLTARFLCLASDHAARAGIAFGCGGVHSRVGALGHVQTSVGSARSGGAVCCSSVGHLSAALEGLRPNFPETVM